MSEDGNRKKLVEFIDKKAFDPILKTPPDRFSGKDREKFEHVREKTENEKKKFHNDYKTADEVKANYLQNVRSSAARKVNKDLKHLGLPTLPQYKEEFMALCDRLGVS